MKEIMVVIISNNRLQKIQKHFVFLLSWLTR